MPTDGIEMDSTPADRPLTTLLFGPDITVAQRRALYLYVCVGVRLSAALLVLWYPSRFRAAVRTLAAGAIVYQTYRIVRAGTSTPWWSRQWTIAIAVLLLLVPEAYLGHVLLLSVAGGLVQYVRR